MRQSPAHPLFYTTSSKTIAHPIPLFLHSTLPCTPFMINLSMNHAKPCGLVSSSYSPKTVRHPKHKLVLGRHVRWMHFPGGRPLFLLLFLLSSVSFVLLEQPSVKDLAPSFVTSTYRNGFVFIAQFECMYVYTKRSPPTASLTMCLR